MRFSILGWSVLLITLAMSRCPAEGIVDGSIVGGLAELTEMEPLTAAATPAPAPKTVRDSVEASVRQSVPVRDRAATYRSVEVFRNSKLALPLLVADLEPRVVVAPRPMSGRSVGARPAGAWTRH